MTPTQRFRPSDTTIKRLVWCTVTGWLAAAVAILMLATNTGR
jgi:hypothetical protein